jgi:hypothetical protein
MSKELHPSEILDIISYCKLYSFVELVSTGKRRDGTYNYCREALELKATELLKELKKIKEDLLP